MGRETVIELAEPIDAYGEAVNRITLRRPTVRDIRECGYPVRFDEEGVMEPIPVAIARYVKTLGDLPMGSVDQMVPSDFNQCMKAVMSFFGESPGTSATSQGKSAPSSEESPPTVSTGRRKT